MISLESQPTDKALARLAELERRRQEATAAGDELPPVVAAGYRDPLVKACIVAETNGKCAYCESKVTHIYWGDVEHILAKALHPDQMLNYENLTLACSICNVNKSDYDEPMNPLLNPYADDPAFFLVALGPLVWHRPGQPRAETTVTVLQLNRSDLVERREQRLRDISRLADKYATATSEPLKQALASELTKEAAAECEFPYVVRAYLATVGLFDAASRVNK